MNLPRLKTRPLSTQTTTVFRGLERRPGAGIGWWANERNLSADRAPVMSVRKARGTAQNVDGNQIDARIVAMCGGDRMVVLDELGRLWSGGHYVNLNDLTVQGVSVNWSIDWDEHEAVPGVVPTTGSDATGLELGGLTSDPSRRTVTFRLRSNYFDYDPDTAEWESDASGTWQSDDPRNYGLTVTAGNYIYPPWEFRIHLWPDSAMVYNNTSMIRMGTYVLLYPQKIWVNAVKLASGQEMVLYEDYGMIELNLQARADNIILTLCDIDGNDMQGVTVSATEPQQQTGKWLDTSGDKPVLREWSQTQTMWVTVASTYIKVAGLGVRAPEGEMLRAGDTAELSTGAFPSGTDDAVLSLLNSAHYVIKVHADEIDDMASWFVIEGLLPDDEYQFDSGTLSIDRTVPEMDFVVEAQNRLWGCRYDETAGINEIYGSKLGDFRNWEVFQGLSTDSWRASRGTAAPFTGAATLDGKPLFFREESLEKVFPSSAGAHQIATYDLEGVQEGSADSLVVIEDRLFYKSRQGVMVYAGTMPQRISPQFGEWLFSDATAARHGRKYCVSMTPNGTGDPSPTRVCAVYDLATGDWHVEDEAWEGRAITWEDKLYYIRDGQIVQMDGGEGCQGVSWWAESQPISHDLPEHKWITYLRLRFKLELGAACRVYISYDDGPWLRKGSIHGNRLHSQELGIWPRRCDHFRLRIEGCGGCELHSVSYRMERSEGGH